MPPKKRTSLRARAANKSAGEASSVLRTSSSTASAVPRTKKAKRTLKHDTLLRRVRDAGIQKTAGQNKRRRRPHNKLRATEDISGLRDALPTISSPTASNDGEDDGDDGWEGIEDSNEDRKEDAIGLSSSTHRRRHRRKVDNAETKIRLKSLQHRPGAMKRKRILEQREVERFGRNLAQMAQPTAAGDGNSGEGGGSETQREKWAALRRFIGGTTEKDRMFESKTGVGVV